MSGQQAFSDAVGTITARIAGRSLDGDLQSFLNENFPPGGEAFDDLATRRNRAPENMQAGLRRREQASTVRPAISNTSNLRHEG